jgi:hypothetical protein
VGRPPRLLAYLIERQKKRFGFSTFFHTPASGRTTPHTSLAATEHIITSAPPAPQESHFLRAGQIVTE